MKKLFLSLILIIAMMMQYADASQKDYPKDKIISSKLFSITMPGAMKGTYIFKKNKNTIYIYDKSSKKGGFEGFAFAIRAYKNPQDHAVLPGSRKLGELVDKKGTLYDMVLKNPTDIQYDYNKEEPKTYKILYNLGDIVKIEGVNGAKYYKNQGMKGKDLYKEVLNKHIAAITEKWDSKKLEQENMSYMYNVIAKSGKNPLDKIGYVYHDLNADGIDELLIGEITQGVFKGIIYDIYTMTDRKPMHVISGGTRDRYFTNGYFLINEYLTGAKENGWLVYTLVENSTILFPQVGFKYDEYENKNNPWFISYDFKEDKWENVSKDIVQERKAVFDNYVRFNYTPLSRVK